MGKIKLKLGAGKATMSPPVGPILGQNGIPGQLFCQQLNKQVSHIKEGTPIRVVFNYNLERSVPKKIPYTLDWNTLLRTCFIYKNNKRYVNIERIYELTLIAGEIENKLENTTWIKNKCRSYIHQLKSMNCTIISKYKNN